MRKLGKRWSLFGGRHARYEDGAVVKAAGPSDAEVIARVARLSVRVLAGPGDLDEVVRDMQAILVRSDAGRAVLGRPLDALGEDPVDVLTRERDEARRRTVQVIGEALAREERLRERLVAAQGERDSVTRELGEWMRAAASARAERDAAAQMTLTITAERDEATRELSGVNAGYHDLVDGILDGAPESWDGEDSGHSIALGYVRELEARLDALRVPREKYPEDGDGAPWPDARTDPNGFADAARAYQEMHSGCRCTAFGERTPEHAPSVLCKPGPGDRRCLVGDAVVLGGAEKGDSPWTLYHGAEGFRSFRDDQHHDTPCGDRPHCTIVDHHGR